MTKTFETSENKGILALSGILEHMDPKAREEIIRNPRELQEVLLHYLPGRVLVRDFGGGNQIPLSINRGRNDEDMIPADALFTLSVEGTKNSNQFIIALEAWKNQTALNNTDVPIWSIEFEKIFDNTDFLGSLDNCFLSVK